MSTSCPVRVNILVRAVDGFRFLLHVRRYQVPGMMEGTSCVVSFRRPLGPLRLVKLLVCLSFASFYGVAKIFGDVHSSARVAAVGMLRSVVL